MQRTTDFASPGIHLLVGLPYVGSELQWLCRNDGSMAQKSGIWILLITAVKNLRQGFGNPRCVGIEKFKQSYISLDDTIPYHGTIVTIPIMCCMGK